MLLLLLLLLLPTLLSHLPLFSSLCLLLFFFGQPPLVYTRMNPQEPAAKACRPLRIGVLATRLSPRHAVPASLLDPLGYHGYLGNKGGPKEWGLNIGQQEGLNLYRIESNIHSNQLLISTPIPWDLLRSL